MWVVGPALGHGCRPVLFFVFFSLELTWESSQERGFLPWCSLKADYVEGLLLGPAMESCLA